MPYHDFSIDLEGTPDEITAMLNVASRVEPGCYQKKRLSPGVCRLWFRGEDVGPANDLMAAIKKRAGLTARKGKTKVADEPEPEAIEDDDVQSDS